MTFLNFNKQCPAEMEVRTVYGMTIKVCHCILLNGHTGPHRGNDGSIFMNPQQHLNHVKVIND